jgi:hypothetical protein
MWAGLACFLLRFLRGPWRRQAFLPLLGTDLSLAGRPGRILNMSSIYASYTLPFQARHGFSLASMHCQPTPALSESQGKKLGMCTGKSHRPSRGEPEPLVSTVR